MLESKKK